MTIIDLEKSLSELHNELERLLPASELAEKALEAVEIAKSIPAKHQKLIDELKSVFIDPKELEKEDFVNVSARIGQLIEELNNIKQRISQLADHLNELINQLESIPDGINNIQKRLSEINEKIDGVHDHLSQIQDMFTTFISKTEDGLQKIHKQLDIQNKKILEIKSSVLMAVILSGLTLIALVIIYFLK